MAKILLLAFEILPYPIAADHPIKDWKKYGTSEDVYQWCWDAALHIGLVDEDADSDNFATKSQVKKAIRILEKHDYDHIPEGNFQGKNLLPENTLAMNWLRRNGVLLGFNKIPAEDLKRFEKKGWSITYSVYCHKDNRPIGDFDCTWYFPEKSECVCDMSNKRLHITTSNPSTIALGVRQALTPQKSLSNKIKVIK